MPMPLGSNIYANMIYYDSRGNQTDKSRDKKIFQKKIDEKSILPVNQSIMIFDSYHPL